MAKPKIFVSHSSLDAAFASRLVNDLNALGAQAWMDSNDLGSGNFQQRISDALADCEWFLLVLSDNALASDWVRMEVDAAIRLKNQGKIKELIFIKAATLDPSKLPALWGVFNVFDANADREVALARTVKVVGLPFRDVTPFDHELEEAEWLLYEKQFDAALTLFERTYQTASALNPREGDRLPGITGDHVKVDIAAARATARAIRGMIASLLNLWRFEEADKAHAEAKMWAEVEYFIQKWLIIENSTAPQNLGD